MDNNTDHRVPVANGYPDRNGNLDNDNNYVFRATEEQKSRSRLGSLDEFWRMHRQSLEDPGTFWSEAASSLYWKVPVSKENICNYNFDIRKGKIFMEWMKGATTNICYNALDRNIQLGFGDQIAYYWEGNDPQDSDKITYRELLRRVCRFANVLKSKGVKQGDMVAIYLPMIPEVVISMLACARIGAVHSVVFAGYSAESLADRIINGNCKVLVTTDGVWRGKKFVHLKNIVDKTVDIFKAKNYELRAILVVRHQMSLLSTQRQLHGLSNGSPKIINGYDLSLKWNPDLEYWWHTEMERVTDVCEPVWVDAEQTLFTLFTSGSTGIPKGCVHTTGGYMVYGALSFKYVFDYFPGDVMFVTGDIGWLTGHTYTVYGSLLNAATSVLYEGVPTHPDAGRLWEIVEKYSVSHFYTAPTAIRTLMRYDDSFVTRYDRSTLKVLACVGEPINKDAWLWYHRVVGEGRCPIVDTFWQTETGGHLLTPIPFCTPLKPGCASLPFFGVEPAILDEDGKEIQGPGKGYLAFKRPWPAIMRTIFGDHKRFENTYFRQFPGYYFTGDGGMRDEDGFLWVTGRVDDMVNVSGRLLSTVKIETVLLGHKNVVETAVVPCPHPLKGDCLYCFIVMRDGCEFDKTTIQELKQRVEHDIGHFARPEYFQNATALPKTRSGKTVRRILRKIAEGDRNVGDLSTLTDENVVAELFESRKYVIQL